MSELPNSKLYMSYTYIYVYIYIFKFYDSRNPGKKVRNDSSKTWNKSPKWEDFRKDFCSLQPLRSPLSWACTCGAEGPVPMLDILLSKEVVF